jgi:peroxiredoxin family protein
MSDRLAVVVSTCDVPRLWSLLSLVAAHAARGGQAAVFLSGDAARIAQQTFVFSADHIYEEKGVATPAQLLESCLDLSVHVTVCQTGMHLCDMTADQLKPGMTTGGMLAWLTEHKDSELLFV